MLISGLSCQNLTVIGPFSDRFSCQLCGYAPSFVLEWGGDMAKIGEFHDFVG